MHQNALFVVIIILFSFLLDSCADQIPAPGRIYMLMPTTSKEAVPQIIEVNNVPEIK